MRAVGPGEGCVVVGGHQTRPGAHGCCRCVHLPVVEFLVQADHDHVEWPLGFAVGVLVRGPGSAVLRCAGGGSCHHGGGIHFAGSGGQRTPSSQGVQEAGATHDQNPLAGMHQGARGVS